MNNLNSIAFIQHLHQQNEDFNQFTLSLDSLAQPFTNFLLNR